MRARGPGHRYVAVPMLVLALGGALGGYSAARGGSSSPAAVSRAGTAFSRADLDPQVRAGLAHVAREEGLDPAALVEMGGVGSGALRRSAFVGIDRTGEARVAFFGGTTHTDFLSAERLLRDRPMFVYVTAAGTTTEMRKIGVVGLVSANVARVTVTRANGEAFDARISRVPRLGLGLFATIAEDADLFPRAVKAFSRDGSVVADESVSSEGLCSKHDPRCLER
jgi:hypothetical protein